MKICCSVSQMIKSPTLEPWPLQSSLHVLCAETDYKIKCFHVIDSRIVRLQVVKPKIALLWSLWVCQTANLFSFYSLHINPNVASGKWLFHRPLWEMTGELYPRKSSSMTQKKDELWERSIVNAGLLLITFFMVLLVDSVKLEETFLLHQWSKRNKSRWMLWAGHELH